MAGEKVIRKAIEAARKVVAPEDLLMGIHNTSEGRKLDMIERLGGLPAPSIAITKPSQGYASFGDISLVAPVEMVTPGRKTPVFGSDVYSPRFPDVEDDQIFRGFTPSGNRRYAPLTMENVLREMKGNVRGGENFNYGPASIRAQVTPQFSSLPEMQAAREKVIPSSEFAVHKGMSDEMLERLRERFEPYFKPTDPYRRSWSAFPEVLTDYARTGRPSEFAYDYKDLPAEALTDARSFLSHLRDMPTEYFEAKPQRAVPLSEFSGAVVPADIPGSVVDRIRNMGINRIEEYGDDASRAEALMKFVGEQGFADGGPVDAQAALDRDAAFLDMSKVFPDQAPSTPPQGGKVTTRAISLPLVVAPVAEQPTVVDRALDVVRAEPRALNIPVSRRAAPPSPVRAPAPAPAEVAPNTSESRRLWDIYNETGNPADFVRASNAMRAGRAEGGRLLEDEYPTHYLPNVGRQVMADGGETAQSRRRATLDQLGAFEDRPVMDPATMGENWANAVRRFRESPVRPGEAAVRPLELGGRDAVAAAIAGDGGITRSRIADIVTGSRGLPGSGTLGMGVADLTPAGIPLAVSDFSDALRNEDYLSAGLTAGLPAAYFARKPIMAAGRAVYDAGARAVDAARDVMGRVPAPVAASGAGAAVMTPEEAEAGKLDAIRRGLEAVRGIRAYHGSPHSFDRFDLSKIGTGEGAQAYGHGLYFAEAEPVARGYRDKLTTDSLRLPSGEIFDPSELRHMNMRVLARRNLTDLDSTIEQGRRYLSKVEARNPDMANMLASDIARLEGIKQQGGVTQNKGSMYEVNIRANPEDFIDFDAPFEAQPSLVQKVFGGLSPYSRDGMDLARRIESRVFADEAAAKGIPGIKYLDQGSRGAGKGSRNYVVFDDKLIDILRKYGIPLMSAGTGASALQEFSSPREETVP